MATYEEFRARIANDPVLERLIDRIVQEKLRTGAALSAHGTPTPLRTASGIPPGYITYQAAADLVGYHVSSVRDLVHDGYIESLHIGRFVYVPRTAFLRHVLHHAKRMQRERALALLGDDAAGLDVMKEAVNA
jgi:excisionase family DNA binding protein